MSTLPVSSPETAIQITPKVASSLVATSQDYGLTVVEQQEVDSFNKSMFILGPAAGAILICPGNQDALDEQDKCPHSAKCPLLRMHKAVPDKLCLIELRLTEERFGGWCKELEVEPDNIPESERVSISDLVWIDIQETRALSIISKGEEARLTATNPKEVHPETFVPIAWEKVIHPVVERLDQLLSSRQSILKQLMLTRELKWKKAMAEGKGSGNDLSTQQAARADKVRRRKSEE